MEWFYDKNGHPVFFQYDDRLIDRLGRNLCWVFGNHIYSLRTGRHIGWFEDGKAYDIENGILAFLKNATGLPYKPGIGGTPATPGIPGKPGKPGKSGIYGRPGYRGFSSHNPVDYFLTNQ